MVDDIELDDGAPDRPCATCGHDAHLHRIQEVELPGRTVRQTVCESCDRPCDFVPAPEP